VSGLSNNDGVFIFLYFNFVTKLQIYVVCLCLHGSPTITANGWQLKEVAG